MVETRRQRAYIEEYDEEQFRKALRQSLVHSGQLKKGKIKQTTIKQSFAKTTKPKPTPKGRAATAASPLKKSLQKVQSGKVVLSGVKYEAFPYQTMRNWQAQGKIKPPKLPLDYWPYPDNPGKKLGHNFWKHLNWKGPNEAEVRFVNAALDQRHAQFEHKSYVNMPAHATSATVNIDVCIQTIFAQSTGNEIAIDTHCRLRNTFTYESKGRRVAGKIPNWHTIRCLQQEELEQVLRQGGFHLVRARALKELLDMVYEMNRRRSREGLQIYEHAGNPPDAVDFVPGLLSLDFLSVEGDDTTEAVLGRLLELPQIGLKSAMCVLAFAMKRECFPVDVHVLRMSKWLGWLPKDCDDANKAAMFLHAYVPGPIMFNLHQAIWIHCAAENTRISDSRDAICLVCGSSPPPKGIDVAKALKECPLTAMLPPLEKRWGTRYKPEKIEAEELADSEAVESNQDIEMSDREVPVGEEFGSDSEETLVNSESASSPSSPATSSFDPQIKPYKDLPIPFSKTVTKKNKKLNLEKAMSIRFEDVPEDKIEDVQAAGFLLWEFRPMDNSFMEEYGKVEKFPRFKWEKPDIMDPEAAVTVQYAKEVLAGKRRHRWSVTDAEIIAVAQAIGTVNA